MLKEADPKAAGQIHVNNQKRVIRALEDFHETGERKFRNTTKRQRQKTSPYNFAYFVLNDERSRLYERIDRRVDQMLADGLVEEVARFKRAWLYAETWFLCRALDIRKSWITWMVK